MRKSAKVHGFARSELSGDLGLLREPGDATGAFAGIECRNIAAVQTHRSGSPRLEPGERTKQGRLARTVGPDDSCPAFLERAGFFVKDKATAERHLQ